MNLDKDKLLSLDNVRDLKRVNRIQHLISEIWKEYSDLRYMQLISVISESYAEATGYGKREVYEREEVTDSIHAYKKEVNVDLFFLEDKDLEEFLIGYLKDIKEGRKDY